ncbi:MAG TPA: alpha-2-macroglobulin family protein, partial [Symbiobacteriaceae bacterium]|nr:alpha-2-macroglobulin family protein [Symbiobacteriaceae bacterium]
YALEEQDLPGTNVFAVNFDGRQYRSAVDYSLRVDPKEKEMRVAVTVDKESYRPGETVTVHVETRNKAGRPVQAAVNLNLVDEALYALMDQQVNLPQDLYGEWVWSGVIRTRASHAVPRPGSGAEKGGDGGGARKDFKDAVFFETVTTDGNGRAVASFKVPDNLTTWRLTWQAVVPGTMEVASGTTGVKVSLPFFVETVLAETYLTGDQPVFTARTYGTALNTGYAVSLAAWLEGPVALARKNAPSTAFQLLGFALPVLSKPGTYQATMEAIGPDGLKDAVQKEFTVVDSYLRQKQVTFDLLEPGARLKQTGDSLVRLAFSDHDRGRYLRLLQQMRWQWGNRFEQKLARMTANDLLTRYFADARGWWGEEPDLDTFAYQTPDGGVSILPYADSDLYLTVLAADLKPDGFDQVTMEEYFQRILDDDGQGRERKVLALYGMAAIGRPVLTAAQELLAAKDLSLQEQLYLALTLAELGDLEGARPYYRAVISQHGEALGPAARIRTGRDQDEILSNTALAGVAAAKLNEPEGPALASYLMENHTAEILLVLEQTLMAAEALPQLPQSPVSFTMLLDGQTVTKELKPGQVLPMTVTQAQARSLQITAVTGKVGLTVTTEGPATRADLTQQEGFHVERTYQAVGGAAGTQFNMGDLVRITLYATIPGTAPGGAYELADYLPAGLRIVQRPWESGIKFTTPGDPSWPLEVNGQRVSFWVGKEPKYPITYYARVVSPGDFTAEEPVLQHQRSGVIYGHGERQKVHIE